LLRRQLWFLFFICFFILTSLPTALCRSPAPTVYVAGNSSGDYNCDGKDDNVQINQALKFVADNSKYTTVHLKGPFTYVIDDTLLIGSNTILEGDSTAVIKLVDNAGWAPYKPLIKQMSGTGNSNIVIRGFEVNVNYGGNADANRNGKIDDLGDGYYNIIHFTNCNNVKVYNMYMHDGHGDGLRIDSSKNIQFYNNRVDKLGHDGLFVIRSQNIEAWNNKVVCRTNSAFRVWNSNHIKLHDNVIDSLYYRCTGGPGIQIEKGGLGACAMDDLEIYNNVLHDTYGPGIWILNYDTSSTTKEQGKNVHIHHNTFYNTGTNTGITWTGGIIISGFHDTLVENNVFDGAYHVAVANMCPGKCPSYSSKSGYTTIVRNNIIVNTQRRIYSPGGTGYGMINYLTKNHKLVLENNCLYNNYAGNYISCTSKSDIYVNPQFADSKNHDYHLKSVAGRWNGNKWVKDKVNSPCIDAGCTSSDYSNEPEDNGNRINIGRYGNTKYESLSSTSRVKTVRFSYMDSNSESIDETGESLNMEEISYADEGTSGIEPTPMSTHETGESLIFIGETSYVDGNNLPCLESNLSANSEQVPGIESVPEAMFNIGENLNSIVKASEVDGDNLTYSTSNLPSGANFNGKSGLFHWMLSDGYKGLYHIF
jgi:hypothetical protein